MQVLILNSRYLTVSNELKCRYTENSLTLYEFKTKTMILGVFGPWQVIAILAVALLLFGGKKIPELMKGLGKGVKEFKDASKPEEVNPEPEEKK